MRPLRVHLLILVLGAMVPGMVLTGVLVWRVYANNRALTERRFLDSARVDLVGVEVVIDQQDPLPRSSSHPGERARQREAQPKPAFAPIAAVQRG